MADAYKVLAQSNPAAATPTDAYTVPALTSTTVSSLVVCNRSPSATPTFRISIAIAGAGADVKQYLYYDLALLPNDTFIATVGITLAATDVIRVYASTTDLSFSFFGVEVT